MDLETENRIAAMLLKEASELRRQAEQEGVLAYLRKPNVRVRPNSRFLTSTVRGVEQANRAVEVNEMWRVRQKELELDNRLKGRLRDSRNHVSRHNLDRDSSMTRSNRHDSSSKHSDLPCSSSRNVNGDCCRPDDEGLRDDEVEEFLRSRVKRGRGSIGSRMDETGPYRSQSSDPHDDQLLSFDHVREERPGHKVLRPERPSWKPKETSDDDDDDDESEDDHDKRKKSKKTSSGSSKKHHSKKHKSKEKTRDKKKKHRHEKRHKH